MDAATLLTLRIPDFEAAIRKSVDPLLATRPVVILTSFKPLGRVLAACPLARENGIAPDMHYPAARACCPDATFLLPDRRLARRAMRSLLNRAFALSPLVEPAGNGRVLLDTRGTERLWGDGCAVAEKLLSVCQERYKLPATAGLAVHRPWSMLASRAAGETGLCHIPPGGETTFLDHVPTEWIDNITPRTRTRLLELNIVSVGQLHQFGREEIVRQFGPQCGETLWRILHPHPWDKIGCAAGQIVADITDDAVRVEAALAEATVEEEKLHLVARSLALQAAATLRARELGAARLSLTLFHADGAIKTAEGRTGGYVQDENALSALAQRLLDRVFSRRVRAVRIWLSAEKLAPPERQGILFQPKPAHPLAEPQRPAGTIRLLAAMDTIRRRYGDESVKAAALLTLAPPVQGNRSVS